MKLTALINGAAAALMLAVAACANGPSTGLSDDRLAAGINILTTGLEVMAAIQGTGDTPVDAVLEQIDEGLDIYCALSETGKATMRAQIPENLIRLAVLHRGGFDGDVCTIDDPPIDGPPIDA